MCHGLCLSVHVLWLETETVLQRFQPGCMMELLLHTRDCMRIYMVA